MREGRGAVAAASVLAALALALVGCSDDEAAPEPEDAAPAGPTVAGDGVVAERTWVGPDGNVEDVVADGEVVLALASSRPGRADMLLRSSDGGRTWDDPAEAFATEVEGQGNDWIVAATTPRLHTAGGVTLAVRPSAPPTGPRIRHDVLVSDDTGETWAPLALAVPDGSSALVSDVAAHDGVVVVAGLVQRDDASGIGGAYGSPGSTNVYDHLDAYDAAAWVSRDGGSTFAPARGLGDGAPGMQGVRAVEWTGERFVAIGDDSSRVPQQCCFPSVDEVSWASPDGTGWVPLAGLGDGTRWMTRIHQQWSVDDDGTVTLGVPGDSVALAPGATEWEADEGAPGPILPDAALLRRDDGSIIGTWIVDTACDCEVAYTGVTGPAGADATELSFDSCRDRSIRGETGVDAPVALGDAVAALAWCNDENRLVASIASSTDGGASWTTARLADLAPEGASDLGLPHPSLAAGRAVAVDGALVALASGVGPSGNGDDTSAAGPPDPGPITAIRVTAA